MTPQDIKAWIVAVEEYASPELKVGAAVGERAVQWVQLLRKFQVPQANIVVSVSPASYHARLADDAGHVTGVAQGELLDAVDCAQGGKLLLVYWIGHGVMDKNSRWVLCSDSRHGSLRVLDVNGLAARLRSSHFARSQMAFFDCCAQERDTPEDRLNPGANKELPTQQLWYFAASSAELAAATLGENSFSGAILAELTAQFPPDHTALFKDLETRFDQLRHNEKLATRPIRIEYSRDPSPGMWSSQSTAPLLLELPPRAAGFFGRQTELAQLIDRLQRGMDTAVVGPAGLGKTALAAAALLTVTGDTAESLARSPFPAGVVYLDLYALRAQSDLVWNTLADKLAGPSFRDQAPAKIRAAAACQNAGRLLITIEGGEEADGQNGRAAIAELCSVFAPQNRRLLLTRLSTQAAVADSITLKSALDPADAANLFDSLTEGRLPAAIRDQALQLLEGHPLALTWAGNLLIRGDDHPSSILADWDANQLPSLSDPRQAEHTLEWLFNRSTRDLTDAGRMALSAAALLAHAPFPTAALDAVLRDANPAAPESARLILRSLAQRALLRPSDVPDHWQFTHVLGYRFARMESGSDAAIRASLGAWLRRHLEADLAAAAQSGQPLSMSRSLEHLSALLRADDSQALWLPLASFALFELQRRLKEIGRLADVKHCLGSVTGWFNRFAPPVAAEPHWQRERSTLNSGLGDVLVAQGDLAGALGAYREALGVSRRLARADPSDTGWQRDLSVSQERVGYVLVQQGDLAGALGAYREALAVRRRLAAAEPSNADWQRDLSVSQERVGDVLATQGDLAGALSGYREALAVRRRLAAADPSNAGWQRDLSVSQHKVGEVLMAQGDLAAALGSDQESLAVIRRLAAADPSHAGWQRDLSVSQERVGDVLAAQGDLAGALGAYREALEVRRRLAAADPSHAGWQRDLSVSQQNVGQVLAAQGDLAGALGACREALAVRRRLTAADPRNAVWQWDLSYILTLFAQIYEKQGNQAEALRYAEEALAIYERLAALAPTHAVWQNDVKISRAHVARLRK